MLVQAAFVTGSLVFVNDAFVSHTVDDRNSCFVGSGSSGVFASFNGINHFFQIGTNHGTQAGIVLALFQVLPKTPKPQNPKTPKLNV